MAASSLTVMVQLQDRVTGPARQATQAVDQFTNKIERSRRGLNQYGENMGKATRSTRKFAMTGLQQAGYQVGDFFVQVGAGTSKLQAFGQQGSQLLGIFGPFGAVMGAGVAIVAALGNAFTKAKKQATDFAGATQALASATADFDREIDLENLDALEKKYGNLNSSTIKLINSQRILAATQERAEFSKVTQALKSVSTEFDVVIARQKRLSSGNVDLGRPVARVMSYFQDNLEDVATRFGVAEDKLGAFGSKLEAVASSKTRDELNNNISVVLDFITANGGATTEAMIELKGSLERLALSGEALKEVEVELLGEGAKKAAQDAKQAETQLSEIAKSVSGSFGDAFGEMIRGTQSASDAFRNMASKIVSSLIDILIVQQLVGAVGTGGKGSGSGLAGKISDMFRADGGPVSGGKPYIVGERGPEMFIPGGSGTIIPNKNMTGGGGTTVVQNINISTGVSQTVRAEIAQLMPQIANSAKAAVLDAKQRGGSFSKAF